MLKGLQGIINVLYIRTAMIKLQILLSLALILCMILITLIIWADVDWVKIMCVEALHLHLGHFAGAKVIYKKYIG